MGSGLPPFQTSMGSALGHTGMGSDSQKSSGLFGVENKTTSNTGGSSPFKTGDLFSSGGPGFPSMDHSAGTGAGRVHVFQENEVCVVWFLMNVSRQNLS